MGRQEPASVGRPMRLVSRSILAMACLLLVLMIGSRWIPWSSPASTTGSSLQAVPSTTAQADDTGRPPSGAEVVEPGPTVVTTKCHERARQLVCHTYVAATSGVVFGSALEPHSRGQRSLTSP